MKKTVVRVMGVVGVLGCLAACSSELPDDEPSSLGAMTAEKVPVAKTCKKNTLGFNQRAYIAKVNCDDFVRDMGTLFPAGAATMETEWRTFCEVTNAMFSENGTTGSYRMYQSSEIEVECCDGEIESASAKGACMMGEEKVGKVAIGKGVNSGCISSAGKSGKFEFLVSGHPPEKLELGMQALGKRVCSDIWGSAKGTFACGADNTARFTSADTSSSNFPSFLWRFFENGTKVAEKSQAQQSMAKLWECKDDRDRKSVV